MFVAHLHIGAQMYIIAGLGNPGKKYEHTRHNMGFITVDKLAERNGIEICKSRFKGLTGEGTVSGEKVMLLKPQTFMNLSGDSVREAAAYYKIPGDHLIVIYDDIDIPLGSIRIRKSGGAGTHNGMRSVVSQLGIEDFPRVRIGIGNDNGDSLVKHVIGKVSVEERKILDTTADEAAVDIEDILKHGIDMAMNMHNVRKNPDRNDN